jgi:biotin carboxylase
MLQLIVWAPTREKAIARMKMALDDTVILLKGNAKHPPLIPLHHPLFLKKLIFIKKLSLM